jgi:hypothetical protein
MVLQPDVPLHQDLGAIWVGSLDPQIWKPAQFISFALAES